MEMGDEQSGAFFQPMDDYEQDGDVAPTGEYIGEIDAAPPAVMVLEPPVEPIMEPVVLAPGVEEVAEEEEEVADAADMYGGNSLEPSPMTAWNNEWQVTLKERKDEENATKAAAVEAAEAQLATFQTEREVKRESRISKNRSDEQDKLEAIEADLENDNSWQRVVKMVELNQDASDGAQDCGRMRDVMIFLKNDSDRAAILA